MERSGILGVVENEIESRRDGTPRTQTRQCWVTHAVEPNPVGTAPCENAVWQFHGRHSTIPKRE